MGDPLYCDNSGNFCPSDISLSLETAKLHPSSLVACKRDSGSKGNEFQPQLVEKSYGVGSSPSPPYSPLVANPQVYQSLDKFKALWYRVAKLYTDGF